LSPGGGALEFLLCINGGMWLHAYWL